VSTVASPRPAALLGSWAPVGLAVAGVLCQVAYPLVDGNARDRLTVATVLVLCAAAVSHALAQRGPAWTGRFVLVVVGGSLAVEAVGVATGFPFGDYRYGDGLGPRLLGVPVVVPLAWAMLAYPCHVAGVRLGRPVLAGAWALASWDLFLDPQMVAEGHWTWADPGGINGIPVSNHLAWLLVALLLMRALPPLPAPDDRVPLAVLLWTWASSVLANLAFWGRPWVALAGGTAMAVVTVPLLRDLRR
jgi:putative membrane protein